MTAADGDITIRDGTAADLGTLHEIYAHAVLHGLASFELEAPSPEEFARRFEALREQGYPLIVASIDGVIAGYGYVGPYRPRPAYRYAVENSVYVAPEMARRGVGRRLLAALIERASEAGYRRMVAVIGDSENWSSIRLHEALGFERAGLIPSVGLKFGRWVDQVIMQRSLGPGDLDVPSR